MKTIQNIDCVGEAYPGQNYYLKFEDYDDDYIACTIEAENWDDVITAVRQHHADNMPVEIEAC